VNRALLAAVERAEWSEPQWDETIAIGTWAQLKSAEAAESAFVCFPRTRHVSVVESVLFALVGRALTGPPRRHGAAAGRG
jgi:hypothetical protein